MILSKGCRSFSKASVQFHSNDHCHAAVETSDNVIFEVLHHHHHHDWPDILHKAFCRSFHHLLMLLATCFLFLAYNLNTTSNSIFPSKFSLYFGSSAL
jgi:hypothetical protein